MKIFIGVILVVIGTYFGYKGYELNQTAAAKIEKEASAIVESIGGDSVDIKENVNLEADIKMFGGGAVALIGLIMIGLGIKKR